jgi:hypothetical protein
MRPSEKLQQSSAPNLVAAQHGAQGSSLQFDSSDLKT